MPSQEADNLASPPHAEMARPAGFTARREDARPVVIRRPCVESVNYAQRTLHLCVELPMAHEIAKLILEHADSVAERTTAIKTALSLGMPLNEIEEYLDWLDQFPQRPGQIPGKGEMEQGES